LVFHSSTICGVCYTAEVLIALLLKFQAFRDITPFRWANISRRFECAKVVRNVKNYSLNDIASPSFRLKSSNTNI